MNNRIIKFRCWNESDEEWFYFDLNDLGWDHNAFYGMCSVGELPKRLGQWTGLLDKNGKEIYEGDIIEWIKGDDDNDNDNSNLLVGIGEIAWFDSGFVCIERKPPKLPLPVFALHKHMLLEVIGNIYENGELLKERALEA